MKSSKVLVTGAAGYIGSHTVVELLNDGYEVIVVDNLNNSQAFILDRIKLITGKDFTFEQVDVNDKPALEGVFKKHGQIDTVIHFAAYKAVNESVENPLKYYKNNIGGLVTLLEVMNEQKVDKLVFSSSCSVYGNTTKLPVTEDISLGKCESPYANTKKIAEEILRDYTNAYASKLISLRYFNPVGAHASALIGELPLNAPSNLLPVITQTAIGKRKSLSVFGTDYNTPDGSCQRDYIHVTDLAKAHIAALVKLSEVKGEKYYDIFNIGTGEGTSVLEVVTLFEKLTGVKLNYTLEKRRTGDVEKIWADPAKANRELGWHSKLGIEETILSAWEWEKSLS